MKLVGLSAIEAARVRIAPVIRATPLSPAGNLVSSRADLWVKEEQRQRTGSFKIRGAYNHIAQLASGTALVAASAGNHAQGVALAAQLCGMPATIFMPAHASLPKVLATERFGATVELLGSSLDDAVTAARAFAAERGAHFVPPFDDDDVIAGQGTIGLELLDAVPDLAAVVVPVGGGGLIAGVAAAIKARRPSCRVIGVEAAGAAAMVASLAAGEPVQLTSLTTIADGIAVKAPSERTLAHVHAFVDDVVTVDDEEIAGALVAVLERAKSLVEPSGAVALAAVQAGRVVSAPGPIAVIQSGGNVDLLLLSRLIEHGLSSAGRYLRLWVDTTDRPGSLAALAGDLAALGLNIVSIDHHREKATLGVDEVEIELTVETRGLGHREEALAELARRGWRTRTG